MPETFQLTVLSPVRRLLDEQVESIIAPGSEGYLGVLAGHAPLITALVPGKLTVKFPRGAGEGENVGTRVFSLSGGFLEVSRNRAMILAEALEAPGEIDVERAKRAADRARGRLKEGGAWDVDRAEAALKRALNRIRLGSEPRD
jgi:F-type H+-transporting ATPase subunit epsilon